MAQIAYTGNCTAGTYQCKTSENTVCSNNVCTCSSTNCKFQKHISIKNYLIYLLQDVSKNSINYLLILIISIQITVEWFNMQ